MNRDTTYKGIAIAFLLAAMTLWVPVFGCSGGGPAGGGAADNSGVQGTEAPPAATPGTPETPAPDLIAAPQNLKATGGNRLISLSWDAVPGATKYHVYWSLAAGVAKDPAKVIDAVDTNANHLPLPNNVPYYYRVSAEDARGEGDLSAETSATAQINGSLFTKITTTVNAGAQVGWSVGIDGGHAIIGIPYYNAGANNEAGAVVFFEETDYLWNWGSPMLTAHDMHAGDRFGWSVAVKGDYAIVGAPNRDTPLTSNVGAAEIFKRTNGEWKYYATLMPDAANQKQDIWFGLAVAISDNYAVVGTWGDDEKGNDAGAVYLFDLPTAKLLQKITASDAAANDEFGGAVAINGSTLIVGAIGKKVAGFNVAGEVYVYEIGPVIKEKKILKASDPADHAWFGGSVALSANYALIGAPMKSGLSMKGDAYVFETTNWTQVKELGGTDLVDGDRYGSSVGIDDQYAVVGAPWKNTGILEAGQVYLYKVGTWAPLTTFMAYDAVAKDHFGEAVAISGDVTLVGVRDKNNQEGAVYLY